MKVMRLNGLKEHLETPQRIVVTNHTNPDGDAMGSALGLAIALTKKGHIAQVVVPNAYPDFLKWLPGDEEVLVAESNMQEAEMIIGQAECIFHLDYNAYSRAGCMQNMLEKSSAVKVLIDHHQQPESWPDYIYSDTAMSSTAQMIYEWLAFNNWTNVIDEDIAQCLYTGLVTDTGSFRFAVTTSRTHRIAAELLGKGVKPNQVYDRVFDSNKIGRLRLLGAMLDKMEYLPDAAAAILYLAKPELMRYQYQKGDSEGFVNYGLSISGIRLSVFLREDKDMVKVSLRSKGNLDVNKLARKFFNGGGHANAAGGRLNLSMEHALEHTRKVISNEIKNLSEGNDN
jgi:phosphoesterase RecJ-like protein